MEAFERVKHELEEKRRQLEHELEAARGRVSEIDADLARVDEAIAALTGGKRKAKSRSRSRKKPAPSVQELHRFLDQVRQQDPFADAHKLQESVRLLVKQSGGSLSGFPSLFAEALATSPGLASEHGQTQPHEGHLHDHGPFGS
jgi:hypothetical protein